jgi:hypothetical protein
MSPDEEVFTLFISSTYLDNVERRKRVEDAVLRARMRPVGMERFAPSPFPVISECERMAGQCHVFLGIVGRRYGWIPDGHEISISEIEYNAAKAAKRTCLMFELPADADFNVEREFDPLPDRWRKQSLLDAFKQKYRKRPVRAPDHVRRSSISLQLLSRRSRPSSRKRESGIRWLSR